MAVGQRESEILTGRDEDDSALVEQMRLEIVMRHPHPLVAADLAEISMQLAAQLRDARALRCVILANSDEPAFEEAAGHRSLRPSFANAPADWNSPGRIAIARTAA